MVLVAAVVVVMSVAVAVVGFSVGVAVWGSGSRSHSRSRDDHTCHILPPSEIELGLCLAVFAGSGGKDLLHRTG